MGIKKLNDILRKYCNEVFVEKKMSDYQYKKIAIDISLYIHKYKSIDSIKWLNLFVKFIISFRKNDIHCIFVYDDFKKAPVEKTEERKKRAEQREKLSAKINELVELYSIYEKTGEIHQKLIDLDTSSKEVSFLRKNNNKNVNMVFVKNEIERIKNQLISITPEDILTTKNLLKLLGVPYIEAEGEAEGLCSWLCKNGYVDAVLSEDTDVLAYNSPVFLTKYDSLKGTFVQILTKDIYEKLDMTRDQFLDLCVMCGNDYNMNLKRIGPERSFKLIKEHGSIEEIGKIMDITPLNHLNTKNIFNNPLKIEIKSLPYCEKPNFSEFKLFCVKNNISYDSNLEKKFQSNISFDE